MNVVDNGYVSLEFRDGIYFTNYYIDGNNFGERILVASVPEAFSPDYVGDSFKRFYDELVCKKVTN